MGSYLGIDEVALSQGELYTILINKAGKGKKGTIVAIIKGTEAKKVCDVLLKMPRRRRFQAREITLDMAPNMELIARTCFPAAKRVTDRFHVQQLAGEAVQEMRIKARWQALDREAVDSAVMIQIWTALITILLLKTMKAMAKYKWHLSNLVAFIRLNLFVKIELQIWLDQPFESPPDPKPQYTQGVLF